MTKPVPEIIPTKSHELKLIVDKLSSMIDEAVAFGTYLLKWDLEVNRPGKDNGVPAAFLRNIIELADSIAILIKESSIDPSKIVLRTLLENSYSLLFMLEKNEKKRALCFMVYKTVESLKANNKWLTDQQEHRRFISSLSTAELDMDFSRFFDHPESKQFKKQKEELLDKDEFNEVYQEYKRTKKLKKNRQFNWYSLYGGPQNFRALSEYLGKSLSYEFFYKSLSDNVHGTTIMKGFALSGKDQAQMIQIRDFEHTQDVFSYTISFLMEIYEEYTTKRIPHKRDEFVGWYRKFNPEYKSLINRRLISYKK